MPAEGENPQQHRTRLFIQLKGACFCGVEPGNRNFRDPAAGQGGQEQEFDVKGEARIFGETYDPLEQLTGKELETALRILDRFEERLGSVHARVEDLAG